MENFLVSIIASIILVFRNIFRVIQDPYKTMREIAKDHDILQVYIIVTGCIAYFIYASSVRFRTIDPLITTPSALSAFITFVCTFALSIVYIQFLSRRLGIEQRDSTSSLLSLSAYSSFYKVIADRSGYSCPINIFIKKCSHKKIFFCNSINDH